MATQAVNTPSGSNNGQPNASIASSSLSQTSQDNDSFKFAKHSDKHVFIKRWTNAYFGSLVRASVAFPIIASVTTVCFYFSPGSVLPFLSIAPLDNSNWYAPVYGVCSALVAIVIFAALSINFATAEGANMHTYGLLKSKQNKLKARLGIEDRADGSPESIPHSKMKQATGMTSPDRCSESALREAYAAYGDVCYNLCYTQSGLQWVLGAGYVNTITMIHRSEEALIEVAPIATVVHEAMHDQEAIKNSAINDLDNLLENLIKAVKDLDPGAGAYFKEHQTDKNYIELQQDLKEQRKVLATLVDRHNTEHANDSIQFDNKATLHDSPSPEAELRARGILREIRHTLNTYRDNLWEGLVQARNHLMVSIALTGTTTHILLCTIMLLDSPANSNKEVIMAATAFYLVGAVAGLFGRFYNESINEHSVDDYGLFTARLIAIPLLSGLAGVGGVLITVVLPVLSGQKVPDLKQIFTLNSQYLFTSAIFGFTPNLLIKSFQRRSQKYASDLESSKAGGKSEE